MHQTWEAAARPPHEVLSHLLDELDDVMAAAAAADADSHECATTPLVTPPDEGGNGGGGVGGLTGGAAEENGGGESRIIIRGGGGGGGGGGGKGFVAEMDAFIRWSHRTGELQKVPPLESVDLPGEKSFTEGCLKVSIYFYLHTQVMTVFLRALRYFAVIFCLFSCTE